MNDKSSLIEFPCDFTLKIIGTNTRGFISQVTMAVLKHYPDTVTSNIVCKESQQNNYTAVTAIVHAQDKPSLDALYNELTKLPGIKMVL